MLNILWMRCENEEEIDDLKAIFYEIDDLKKQERSRQQSILKSHEDLATVFFLLDCLMSRFLIFHRR